jgi:ClpP class serine protease
VAQGRVWTGQQALARHLVDEIGDQARAVEVAKKLVGLPSDAPLRLVHYPKQRGLLDLIEERESLLASVLERTLRVARVPHDLTWSLLDLQVSH